MAQLILNWRYRKKGNTSSERRTRNWRIPIVEKNALLRNQPTDTELYVHHWICRSRIETQKLHMHHWICRSEFETSLHEVSCNRNLVKCSPCKRSRHFRTQYGKLCIKKGTSVQSKIPSKLKKYLLKLEKRNGKWKNKLYALLNTYITNLLTRWEKKEFGFLHFLLLSFSQSRSAVRRGARR